MVSCLDALLITLFIRRRYWRVIDCQLHHIYTIPYNYFEISTMEPSRAIALCIVTVLGNSLISLVWFSRSSQQTLQLKVYNFAKERVTVSDRPNFEKE